MKNEPEIPVSAADRELARRLVDQGLCTWGQIESCLTEIKDQTVRGKEHVPGLGDVLVSMQYVSHHALESTVGAGRPTVHLDDDLPPSVAAAAESASHRLGRYVLVSKLGSGGMGDVWKGWDRDLRRWAAIKLLRTDNVDEVARFRREAHTSAKLNHPNIAPVYDVGEADGRPFIAMQFVEGTTLQKVNRDNPRDCARLVRDAARAVQVAHETGIIHRDLKPANVMVDASGRVYVLDFGLAKETEVGKSISLSGTVVGTPAYMPPEQAKGDSARIDARSDVYGLGTTLYYLLTGRPPFQSENMYDVLLKLTEDEPEPMPDVNRELQTIVMKCLEKDPARRYASAGALADDLTRFLNAEPIMAHPPSLGYRLRKRLAKRKQLVLVGIGAAVVLALAASYLVPRLRKAEGELTTVQDALTEVEQRLVMQMRHTSEAYLDLALIARRNDDLEKMRACGPRVESVCREVIEEVPSLAEPHYRLARMYRALMRNSDALRAARAALEKDPGHAPSLYEDVLATAAVFRRRTEVLERDARLAAGEKADSMRRSRVPHWSELVKSDPEALDLRKRMQNNVDALQAADVGVSEGELLCAKGVLLLAEWNVTAARAALDEAVILNPELEEAHGNAAYAAMTMQDFAEAEKRLEEAIERDKGYVLHYVELAGVHRVWADKLKRTDLGAAIRKYEQAIAMLGEALEREPNDAEIWRVRGEARNNLAYALKRLGRDYLKEYEECITDFSTAAVLAPRDARLRTGVAAARMNLALTLTEQGVEPFSVLADVALYLDGALALEDREAEVLRTIGDVQVNWAVHLLNSGADPTKQVEKAVEALDRSLKLEPATAGAWARRGDAHSAHAMFLHQSRKDPRADFQAAIRDYSEALVRNEGHARAWHGRGVARAVLGQMPGAPATLMEKAVEDFDAAIEIESTDASHFRDRATARMVLGHRARAAVVDPVPYYEDAVSDFTRVLELRERDIEAYLQRGEMQRLVGEIRSSRNTDPRPQWTKALADFGKALEIDESLQDTWRDCGAINVNTALVQLRVKESPEAFLDAGEKALEQALALDASDEISWLFKGNLHSTRAGWLKSQGKASIEEHVRCADAFEKAVSLNPDLEERLGERIRRNRELAGVEEGE